MSVPVKKITSKTNTAYSSRKQLESQSSIVSKCLRENIHVTPQQIESSVQAIAMLFSHFC